MAHLFINKFYTLFIGHFFDNIEHKHHAIQLCSKLDSKLEISLDNNRTTGEAFLIAPDYSHKIIGGTGELFLLFLDPETKVGRSIINKYLKSQKYMELDLSYITKDLTGSITAEKINNIVKNLFRELDLEEETENNARIVKILNYIDQDHSNRIKVKEIARVMNLSVSRIQHIFKEEVGISINKYLLWKRIGNAVQLAKFQKNLTWIAHEAGFSDSAHFSRTFKHMFGVCLKDVFKASDHVNICFLS